MHIISSSLVISFMLLGCAKPSRPSGGGTKAASEWERNATAMLEAAKCQQAIAYLNTVEKREPLWYEFVSRAHITCWRQDSSPAHAKAAIDVIEQGLKAFPGSANLLLSLGYRHEELGLREMALRDYRAAEAEARASLANHTDGQREVDESVLQAATHAA